MDPCTIAKYSTKPCKNVEIVLSILDGTLKPSSTGQYSLINRFRRMSSENRTLSGAVLLLGLLAGTAWAANPKSETEPRAFSIHPFGNPPGSSYDAQIRGVKLQDAQALWFETE